VLGKLLFVKDIHVLLMDEDLGGSVFGRAAESNSVAYHEGADGEFVVVEGMRYRCHCKENRDTSRVFKKSTPDGRAYNAKAFSTADPDYMK
jgi:hypothetical protein